MTAVEHDDSRSATLRAMIALLVAMASFTLNDAFMKLVTVNMPLGEAIFIRSAFAFSFLWLISLRFGRIQFKRAYLTTDVVVRSIAEVLATVSFLSALMRLPIGNLMAILQAIPLVVTAGGALFFGMQVGWRRWLAIMAGLVGVIIVIDPRVDQFNAWALLAVFTVLCSATRDLATRKIPKSMPSLTLTALTTIVVAIMGLALGLGEDWYVPSPQELGQLFIASSLIIIAYGGVIIAMRSGNFAAAAPMRYSGVVWGLLLGYVVWNEVPSAMMLFGTSIIIASGVYSFWRERLRHQSLAVESEPLNEGAISTARSNRETTKSE